MAGFYRVWLKKARTVNSKGNATHATLRAQLHLPLERRLHYGQHKGTWIEAVLAPWMARTDRDKLLLILDNCGPHNVAAVRATFEANNISVMMLPPNMTAALQPMDLVVNSIIKSSIRRERIRYLAGYFKEYKAANAAQQALPNPVYLVFWPPKPTKTECLQNIRNELQTDRFKDSLWRAFVTSCLATDTPLSVPAYLKYQPKLNDTLGALKPAGPQVMDLFHDIEVDPRLAEADDAEAEDLSEVNADDGGM
jgi:hypothetical protein